MGLPNDSAFKVRVRASLREETSVPARPLSSASEVVGFFQSGKRRK